jgi:hypothetical protein
MSESRNAALRYAGRGWHVFPLVPRRKVPLTRHGLKDASCDLGLVTAWWAEHPNANIGIACGPSGLVVVDIDGEEAGHTWADLAARHGGHPRTLTAATAKGWHLYFAGQGRSTTGRIAPHVDSRGLGGYVCVPPSIHESGVAYHWLDPDAPVAPLPTWIRKALEPTTVAAVGEPEKLPDGTPFTNYGLAALAAFVDEMSGAAEGTRNDTLNAIAYLAGRLVAAGQLAAHVARTELVAAGLAAGLGGEEVGRTFGSGFAAGLQVPARIEARR